MLKNQNIICISSIDWDFIWQGHQEVMSTFAKEGNRVLFIENTGVRSPNFRDIQRLRKRILNWFKSIKGFRKEEENLYVYSPIILPFPYSRIARWINRYMLIRPIKRWMKVMEFYEPIVWTFLPTGIALDIINNVDRRLLVYYCIADFYELAGSIKKVSRTENELIRISDLIFVQGDTLRKKCERLNDQVYKFPFGVRIETFDNFRLKPNKVPNEMRDIKRPVIGYVGGLHRHIDFALIRFIAQTHPEWSLVLIGPVQTDISKIKALKNVFLLDKKDFSILPVYISQFDVGIVPYDKSGYTATVFPTKLNEYHAMGKPVVSTELPEILNFNAENSDLVLVGKTYKEIVDCILKALNSKSDELINQRILSAKRNSWTSRIEQMSNLLRETLEKKSRGPLNWQESFLKFYRVIQKRMLKAVAVALSIYVLIFYTPLVWLMANPLKISEKPINADCIVVFAGGVGESGQAGQGYEERVQYAVELYKEGFARNIIFSSGYSYVFKEPLLMRTLAVSLGVPSKAIISEDRAKSTYENVKFSKEILDANNWNKVLLVSSPYHMRRVAMVMKRSAPQLQVTYTPIPTSRFYSRKSNQKTRLKQISLKQMKAILHEYLGIIYYWWKKYI